ncbi:hypothetical protein FRC01_003759, partial [Tulasnella sp. 417]
TNVKPPFCGLGRENKSNETGLGCDPLDGRDSCFRPGRDVRCSTTSEKGYGRAEDGQTAC